MRIIVIYKSRTGFTKRYAQWIAEDLGCEIAEYERIRTIDLQNYDLIIYGGRVHAGKIDNLDAMRKRVANAKRKLVVFATGATPVETKEEIEKLMDRNFGDSAIPRFYMQSGLCYEKMGLADKSIMKALSKMLSKKNGRSAVENETANAIGASYDISDKGFIRPLLECVKEIRQHTASGENRSV